MIFKTSKKLLALAKGLPPLLSNMSPVRLFATAPAASIVESDSVILDPPTWPKELPRDFVRQNIPVQPNCRIQRRSSVDGRIIEIERYDANRIFLKFQQKRRCYEAQQARIRAEQERTKPIPLATLHSQAVNHLIDSDDKEDQIFLAELARLRNEPNNLDKCAATDEWLEDLQTHRDRFDYAAVARDTRVRGKLGRTFSSFRRDRDTQRQKVEAAAARRMRQRVSPKVQPTAEERRMEEVRKERERKRAEYEAEKAFQREEARAHAEKVRMAGYRETIRECLEQGRPIPDNIQPYEALIREVTEAVRQAAMRRDRDAEARAEASRQRQLAIERERLRRAQQEEAARQLQARLQQQEAALEQERRAREERQRQEAAFAKQRAAQEERLRQEQLEAERRRAEAAAQAEAEAKRAEEAYRQQQQAEQTSQAEELAQFFQTYDAKWDALRSNQAHSDILFSQFPWPVLFFPADISTMIITEANVRNFYQVRGTTGKALKSEILRWHPDKLNNQLYQVHSDHREQVREAGELVAKFLNRIKN